MGNLADETKKVKEHTPHERQTACHRRRLSREGNKTTKRRKGKQEQEGINDCVGLKVKKGASGEIRKCPRKQPAGLWDNRKHTGEWSLKKKKEGSCGSRVLRTDPRDACQNWPLEGGRLTLSLRPLGGRRGEEEELRGERKRGVRILGGCAVKKSIGSRLSR